MKYSEEFCSDCKEETIHRVFRRFGRKNSDGSKTLKRIVTWCMTCQKRRIVKSKSYKG